MLALARDPQHRFACGVAKFGDCDILASWAQGDRIGREDLERQMGHPSTNRAGYRAGSPIHDVAAIQAPLLILHGADDERVRSKQSEQLVEALKREGKTFEFSSTKAKATASCSPAISSISMRRWSGFWIGICL